MCYLWLQPKEWSCKHSYIVCELRLVLVMVAVITGARSFVKVKVQSFGFVVLLLLLLLMADLVEARQIVTMSQYVYIALYFPLRHRHQCRY